ncbi:hypothetical protein HG530_013117 [Fusarium avenaceum]|nr:hypothetical protein HG530_013117 [Fusarium avenaceum]
MVQTPPMPRTASGRYSAPLTLAAMVLATAPMPNVLRDGNGAPLTLSVKAAPASDAEMPPRAVVTVAVVLHSLSPRMAFSTCFSSRRGLRTWLAHSGRPKSRTSQEARCPHSRVPVSTGLVDTLEVSVNGWDIWTSTLVLQLGQVVAIASLTCFGIRRLGASLFGEQKSLSIEGNFSQLVGHLSSACWAEAAAETVTTPCPSETPRRLTSARSVSDSSISCSLARPSPGGHAARSLALGGAHDERCGAFLAGGLTDRCSSGQGARVSARVFPGEKAQKRRT